MTLRLGIIGHGFVGKATDSGFQKSVKKFIVDPDYDTTVNDLENFLPDFIFICVPTPMKKNGELDSSIIEEVFENIEKSSLRDTPLIVKSTILPDKLHELFTKNNKLVYNPEFLREKTADEDFINSKFVILGGEKKTCKMVKKIYEENSLCKTNKYFLTDIESASIIKYSINSFLATKVIFFNQMKDIFNSTNSLENWDDLTSVISLDERIGSSHMMVPGHDGKLGFGGACFPKDVSALIAYSKKINKDFSLLDEVKKINNEIRNEYDSLSEREIEQNISFD